MCGTMADIQSPTAEIRRGKKERKKEETIGQKYDGLPYSIGRPSQRPAENSPSAKNLAKMVVATSSEGFLAVEFIHLQGPRRVQKTDEGNLL